MEHPDHPGYVQLEGSPHLWVCGDKVINDPTIMYREANANDLAAQAILAEFAALEQQEPLTYAEACKLTTEGCYRATGSIVPDSVAYQKQHPVCRYKKGNEIGWVIRK